MPKTGFRHSRHVGFLKIRERMVGHGGSECDYDYEQEQDFREEEPIRNPGERSKYEGADYTFRVIDGFSPTCFNALHWPKKSRHQNKKNHFNQSKNHETH